MIQLTIDGEPVAQGRPRFSTRNGFVRAYDPQKSRSYKERVRLVAFDKIKQRLMGPIKMTVDIYRGIPKSWSKVKQTQAEQGYLKPTLKPDVDNYVKAIKDALNGIAYVDDSQVVVLFISKYYSREPRVEIQIEEV
jgi:Holliday junction resolvase RusA-like endonuclease